MDDPADIAATFKPEEVEEMRKDPQAWLEKNAKEAGSFAEIIAPTSPGMDINVTPERDAPIIPNATTYQGDFLFALKKVSFESFLPVK